MRASPRALTISEIQTIVEKYAQAARRVREAGFDGAEMHMAHYALGNAFLSRIQNRRTDGYGAQTLESRAKFNLEVLRRTRELVGPDFVMGVRMNSREWGHELGTTLDEGKRFAQLFERAGADYLQVSAYGYGAFALAALPDLSRYPEPAPEARAFAQSVPHGALIPDAAEVKQAVSIPVSGVGNLEPDVAEVILAKGLVDLVCFGRPLLADPHWPRKLIEGRSGEIRPCMRCNVCLHHILMTKPLRCRANPYLGNETTMEVTPAARPKKVMVVGAGPSGLEAARIAAERGHRVEVYDRGLVQGGLIPLAIFIKGTETDNMQKALDYYERQLKRLGVPVHLRQEVDAGLVRRVAPDVVLLAVGGSLIAPTLAIEAGSRVVTTDHLRRRAYPWVGRLGPNAMAWLARLHVPVGKRVVIVGGDLTGLETAEWLVKRGRIVTVVESGDVLGAGIPSPWLSRLMPWLAAHGARVLTRTIARRATRHGLEVESTEGARCTIEGDTVVLVSRYGANDDLLHALAGQVPEIHRIGDAEGGEPGYVLEAIRDGAEIGIRI